MISQSNYPADPRVRREAEALENAGYEVDIICLPQKGQAKVESFGGVTAYRILNDQRSESMARYFLHSTRFFITAFFKLQQLNSRRKYDLIQIHNMPDSHVFIALMQKLAGTPIVLDIHDLTPELFQSKWNGKKENFILSVVKIAEKMSCRFADKIITVTDGCKNLLIQRGVPDDKVTLILNTPDEFIFKFDAEREFKVINEGLRLIYHGTVAERFGIHLAIEALKYVNEEIPGSIFKVYGKYDDSYKRRLREQIKELGLENNVSLDGRFLIEKIYEFIKASDIGLVPYMNNLYMNLALSTKTFEYAAAGLPVVSTRLQTLVNLFDEEKITYSEPDNARDLADKIIMLCRDPEKRKLQAINAKKALANISWHVMSKRFLNLIDTTIADKRTIKKVNFDAGRKIKDYNKVL